MTAAIGLDALLSLWHGDSHSTGYHHAELVVKACDLEQPSTDIQACALFYPGVHVDEVDEADRRIIGDGFRLWMARMDLPRRKGRVRNVLGR